MGTENALPLSTELPAPPEWAAGPGLGQSHGLLREVLRMGVGSSPNLKHSAPHPSPLQPED